MNRSTSVFDLAEQFRSADTVLLEWAGTNILFSPDNFVTFRLGPRAAGVLSQVKKGGSAEQIAQESGIAPDDINQLLGTVVRKIGSPPVTCSDADGGELPLRPGRPLKKLVLMVNNFCNLACTYCYEHETVFKQQARHMSQEVIERSLGEFFGSFSEIENIMFIGGEPTLSEDSIETACARALEEAEKHGMTPPSFSMITNGVRISERMYEVIERFRIQLTFSVDGPPPVQDLIRIHHDQSGSYNQVKRNFERYSRIPGSQTQVETTVTIAHHNSGIKMIELIDFLAENFDATNAHVVPAGLNRNHPLNAYRHAGLTQEIETASAVTIDRILTAAPETSTHKPVGLFDLAADIYSALKTRESKSAMCPAGTTQLVVDSEGGIYPCWMFSGIGEMAMGNIMTDGLRNPRFDKIVGRISNTNKFRHVECTSCYARHVCHACIGNNHNNWGSIESLDLDHCNTIRSSMKVVLVKISEHLAARSRPAVTLPAPELSMLRGAAAGAD